MRKTVRLGGAAVVVAVALDNLASCSNPAAPPPDNGTPPTGTVIINEGDLVSSAVIVFP